MEQSPVIVPKGRGRDQAVGSSSSGDLNLHLWRRSEGLSRQLTFLKFNLPPPYPAVVTEAPALTPTVPLPVFHQHSSDSQHFGFVPPPPQPDLPASQNYYALPAAQTQKPNSQRSQPPSRPLSRQPSMLDVRDPAPSQLLYGNVALKVASGITDSQVDPVLLSNSHIPSACPLSQMLQSININRDSDLSMTSGKTSDSLKSSDDEQCSVASSADEGDGSGDEGWGATNRREIGHPALRELEDEPPQTATHGNVVNVLDSHHRINGVVIQSETEMELLKRIRKLGEADGNVDGESERDPDPDLSGRCRTTTMTFRRLKTTERQKGDIF
ncbi:hypothetical protein V8E55_010319 [Tylopilus felleus]